MQRIVFPYKALNGKLYSIHILPSSKIDYKFWTGKTFFIHNYPFEELQGQLAVLKLRINSHLLNNFEPDIKEKILTRIGARLLFEQLDKDSFPKTIEKTIEKEEFAVTSHNWFLTYKKMCSYRISKADKLFCTAEVGDGREILEYECEGCPLPEDFLRCKHLILRTNLRPVLTSTLHKTYDFKCQVGKKIKDDNPYNCTSLHLPCFEDLIIISKEHSTDKRTELIKDLIRSINRALRKAIGENKPKDENDIKRQIAIILTAKDRPFKEEDPQYLFSVKRYRPDLTSDELSIAIEAKLIDSKDDVKNSVKQMNEDINPYKKKFSDVIFVIYDLGFIEDEQDYKLDFETIQGVHMLIIKH